MGEHLVAVGVAVDPRDHVGKTLQQRVQLGEREALVGRIGRVEEVAEAVLWLCSDKASFVTGHSLIIDGGFTAR